jgi:four helix bundle protein
MKDFRSIKVWEKSHHLTLEIYRVTRSFPADEVYHLTSQLRRAAASIPTNIAEGAGSNSDAGFARYLQIAMGSASELEYLLLLSHDLAYLDPTSYPSLSEQAVEIKKMLTAFLSTLRK